MNKVTAQQFTNAMNFGGLSTDYIVGTAYDSKENLYVTGLFSNSITLGSTTLSSDGGIDAFLMKMDSKRNVIWVRQIGSTDNDQINDIIIDSKDNVVITGTYASSVTLYSPGNNLSGSHTNQDVYYAQYDGNGKIITAGTFGYNLPATARGLAASKTGKVYLVGQLTVSSTDRDIFISRLDLNSNSFWAEDFGGFSDDIVNDVTVNGNGDIYLAGAFSGTLEFGSFSTNDMTSNGAYDAFFMSIDDNRNLLDVISIPASNSSSFASFYELEFNNNDMYLTGVFLGSVSVSTTTLTNNSGVSGGFYTKIIHNTITGAYTLGYVKSIATNNGNTVNKVKVNSNDEVFISGYYQGSITYGTSSKITSNGDNDIFIGKLKANGDIDYLLTVGSTYDDRALALDISPKDEIILGGLFQLTNKFSNTSLNSKGGIDGFIVNVTEIVPEITFDNAPSQVCQGATFNVTVSGTDLEAGNEFVVLLSDASGSFSTTTQIGKLSSTTGGVISVAVPKSITASDNYKLRVTSSKPSLSADYSSDIYISELPKTPKILGPIKVNEFADAKYSTVLNISSIYNWSVNNGNQLDGGTTNSVTVQWGSNGEGRISVVETDPLGCKSDTGELIVQVGKITGFDEVAEKELEIYPTLATNEITLKTTFDMQNAVYQIVSTDGKVFENKAVSNASVQVINISDLPKGAYFIKLISKDATSIARFQKI